MKPASNPFIKMEGSMQISDDEFPYTSEDPSLAPPENEKPPLTLKSQRPSDLKASLRLAVGSTLSGSDAYIYRLRKLQAAQKPIQSKAIAIDEDETYLDQLKYALIGILFETPDLVQRGLTTTDRVTSSVFGLFSKILSPITNNRIFSPVKNGFDYAAERGENVVDRLIMKGRIEAHNSRQIVKQENVDDLVNDLLEYLVEETELMQLIQEEGFDIAGDVVNDFREESAAIDTTLERKLKALMRKKAAPQPDAASINSAKKV
jgi:polyhydroxyalkanoate synthesis regulator phasin